MALERIRQLKSHLTTQSSGLAALEVKRPDDVVITLAVRSPLCKSKKGALKDTRSDELLTSMFKAAIQKSQIDPSLIGDICVGTVLAPGAMYQARSAAIAAGIPVTTPVQVINRGLMAVTTIANQIKAGQLDVGLAVGVESMSANPDMGAPPLSEEISAHSTAKDCKEPMGWTSENVANDFAVTREEMDQWAAASFQKASHAQLAGFFKSEIVPIEAFSGAPESKERTKITVTEDDGIRHGTTAESLSKIRSAFPQWGGKTTGGNASQITDGAAAVILMRRSKAEELGLKVIAKWVTTTVVGLAPRVMGIGPSIAIPQVLEMAGITVNDVDLFEINEAFASMMVYCIRTLKLDKEKVNVNGGARQVATGLAELRRRKQKVLVTSMCIGTGMGAAAVFLNEDFD
ncbi:hypothetical protein FRC04_008803 [Tulasnella sp. 424]|nr:hypothetical protein FRC04_008803 [Tulasnella sp. 424]KAG8980032.1 hypothetical protein FRC05_007475 [Tulasnella sp. 425]